MEYDVTVGVGCARWLLYCVSSISSTRRPAHELPKLSSRRKVSDPLSKERKIRDELGSRSQSVTLTLLLVLAIQRCGEQICGERGQLGQHMMRINKLMKRNIQAAHELSDICAFSVPAQPAGRNTCRSVSFPLPARVSAKTRLISMDA